MLEAMVLHALLLCLRVSVQNVRQADATLAADVCCCCDITNGATLAMLQVHTGINNFKPAGEEQSPRLKKTTWYGKPLQAMHHEFTCIGHSKACQNAADAFFNTEGEDTAALCYAALHSPPWRACGLCPLGANMLLMRLHLCRLVTNLQLDHSPSTTHATLCHHTAAMIITFVFGIAV